jgi:3-oxoacyl-[acyl-carrier-protein] synthase III
MHDRAGILGPHYVMGELELEVDSIPGKSEVLAKGQMPDIKELWGWGHYRKTHRSRADLAYATAMGTLEKSRLRPADVDALVLCCSDGLNYHEQNQLLGEVSCRLELGYTFVTWVAGAGCASLFSAVEIARSLVLGGIRKNALVITVDKIVEDAERFQRFGVLSDGACSFIVTHSSAIDFGIVATAVLSCPSSVLNGGQSFQEKFQLIHAVFGELDRRAGSQSCAPSAYFGSNVFIPIQEVEMSAMPIDGLLTYQENTRRYGHCYAADPVINLIDFYADNAHREVKRSIMASSAHGHFGAILLEKTRVQG